MTLPPDDRVAQRKHVPEPKLCKMKEILMIMIMTYSLKLLVKLRGIHEYVLYRTIVMSHLNTTKTLLANYKETMVNLKHEEQ